MQLLPMGYSFWKAVEMILQNDCFSQDSALIKYWLWYQYVTHLSKNTQLCLAMNVFYETFWCFHQSHTVNIGWSWPICWCNILQVAFGLSYLRRKKKLPPFSILQCESTNKLLRSLQSMWQIIHLAFYFMFLTLCSAQGFIIFSDKESFILGKSSIKQWLTFESKF